jgi:hypothetical protein
MAFFFGDGFDLYAACADASLNYWDSASLFPTNSSLVAGRFSGSRAWSWGSSSTLVKASSVNDAVHHFVLAYLVTAVPSGTGNGFYIQLFDGTTAQCSVVFRTDGSIQLVLGGPTSGNVLASYAGAVNTANVWFTFEIEVVISNTNGSITVRKNGNTSNDFFLGSLDTQTSANAYANKMQLGSSSSYTIYLDDFLWRSDAAAVPWVGDVRCFTRTPASDVSVQLSRTTAPVNQLVFGPIGVANAFPNGVCRYVLFTANYSGLVTGVIVNCNISGGGGFGHLKAALFSNSSNTIGTLLATSAEFTDPAAAMVQLTFPTPARVTVGQTYWLGINQDANITYNVINSSSVPATCIQVTQPYASWPISVPGGTISNFNIFSPTIVYTPEINADVVSEVQQDALASYVFSSTNGQADLYAISSISAAPANIIGVTTRGLFQKTDAGTRNATVQLKSGATTVQGANTPLNNSVWGWIARNDLVDPATGAAWTAAGVNGVSIGPVITA